MAEAASEPVEPIAQHKTCVLKASIHCEGCKRKVKKILSQIHGVEFVDVDTKQQKVTVIGNVETDTLVKKLVKSGKQAQPWPEEKKQPEKTPKIKDKSQTHTKSVQIQTNEQKRVQKENPISDSAPTEPKPKPPAKVGESSNSAAKTDGKNGEVKETEDKKVDENAPVKKAGEVAEKKPEEGSSTAGNTAAEQSGVGVSGKKKKKKGQNRNSGASEPQTPGVGAPARVRPEKQKVEEDIPTNHGPPRQQYYPAQHHDGYYSMPAPPVYGMSYNTAHSSSNYTASYYAAPPQPYSYAYAYPGSSETEPPPPPPSYGYGNEPRPSQSLDSFEMFSDENPNGCIVS